MTAVTLFQGGIAALYLAAVVLLWSRQDRLARPAIALAALGFAGVTNEQMRTTHAKIMTIPKGCEMMGIDIKNIVKALEEKGFAVKQ